jgi:hypothetical protein
VIRALVVVGTVFAAALAVLQFGLARPSASERLNARIVAVLDHTRSRGSVIAIGSRRLTAVCSRSLRGTVHVRLGDGTAIVAMGTHVLETHRLGARRSLTARPAPDLAAAELVLAGSHALYARELIGRLVRRSAAARETVFDGRPAYAVRLRASRPSVELIVDRKTLHALGAVYRSQYVRGTSRLLPAHGRHEGC